MTTASSRGTALRGDGLGRRTTGSIGSFVVRRARLVLVAALLAVVGFGVLGVFVLVLGAYRALRVRSALISGRPMPMDFWSLWLLTAISVVLAVVTMVLVIAEV